MIPQDLLALLNDIADDLEDGRGSVVHNIIMNSYIFLFNVIISPPFTPPSLTSLAIVDGMSIRKGWKNFPVKYNRNHLSFNLSTLEQVPCGQLIPPH